MKNILFVMLLLTWSAQGATVDDIRFRASFDKTVDAQLSAGKSKPTKVTGPLKYESGKFGQALIVGEAGAISEYRIESNLDVKQGAISLWFNPVNWTPGEKRSHVFLRFRHASIFRLFIDEIGRLVFEAGPDYVERCRASMPIDHLKKGEWSQIVATWSAKTREMRLYVNGKLGDVVELDDRFLPLVVSYDFQVGDMTRARGRETPRKTLLDDLTIFRRPILPDEFDRLELNTSAQKASGYETPLISVRKSKSFTIDGRIDDKETAGATAFGSFLNVSDHKLAAIQTTAYCGYTDELLYFAVRSPILPGIALKATSVNQDDQVWTDDAVQIHLAPTQGNHRFHFVGNSKGVIFDRRETIGITHDATWNGKWQVANRTENGSWVMEMAIRFKDLGIERPKDGEQWRVNVTRDRVEPKNLSCWPKLNSFADTDKHGHVRFVGSGPVVNAPQIGPILNNRIAINGNIVGQDDLSAKLVVSRSGAILYEKTSSQINFHNTMQGATPNQLDLRVVGNDGVEHFRQIVPLGKSKSTLTARCTPIPSKGFCNVSIKEQEASIIAANPSAVAELVLKGETVPTRTIHFDALNQGTAAGKFEITNLPPGEYELRVRVEKDGRVLDQTAIGFNKPSEPWRELHVGESDTPPAPWTPMQASQSGDDLQIEIWNRTHQFNGPLPTAIKNGAIQQLAGPVRLEAKVAGKTLTWNNKKITNVQHTATKVSFDASMKAGPLSSTTKAYMEYDGMMWFDLTITPDKPTKLDALDLVIPIKAEYASLMHVPGDFYNTGKTGRKEGWAFDYSANNFFMWIGNEDIGFTWFYELPSQKLLASKDKFVRLERRGDQMLFKVRYIDKPVTLDKPLTLKFGLQVSPVRSRPSGWRSWGAPRPPGNSINIPWTNERVDRYGAGFPEATAPASYTRHMKYQKRYGRVVPYKILLWHAIQSPEWQYNAPDWDLGGGINKYSDTRRFWWGGRVCGAADTFTDFIVWKLRAHINEHKLDGVYHDLQWSYRCGNANHGCAPSRRAIRGDRELNKRLYTAFRQFDRPVLKIDHPSASVSSTFTAFADMSVTGEEMCAGSEEPKKPHHRVWDNYFRVLRIDYFKACGAMGRQWGIVPMFLLQMKQPNEGATEGIFSILLAHDAIPTWDAWAKDIRFMARLWRLLEDFDIGHDAIEFLPYWHETTPAKVVKFVPDGGGPIRPVKVDAYDPKPWQALEEKESYGASIYHIPGASGRSLVVVYNYTQDDATATVKIDTSALGFDPGKAVATDGFTRFDWVRADQPITLKIKHRNFRLIWVENRDVSLASEFPKQEVRLQKLAGDWTQPGEKGRSGEQLIGDLWDKPFANNEDSGIPAIEDAVMAVEDGKDRGNLNDQKNFSVSVYGPHMPMRIATQSLWKFDLSQYEVINSAQLVLDLLLVHRDNPQVGKLVSLRRVADSNWQSSALSWANRPTISQGITFSVTKDMPLKQWQTHKFDVTDMVRDSVGSLVTLAMQPLRPDLGNSNYTLVGRRIGHPEEPYRAARLVVQGVRNDPIRSTNSTGTEVAQVFTLDKPTKLERISIRMRYSGVRGPDMREPIQMKLVAVDDAGLPTNQEVIGANSFALQWVNTAWHYTRNELNQSVMLPAGRYAAVMFKIPESSGEYFHAVIPKFPAKKDSEYLATRVMPDGKWQRQSTVTSFGVFGHVSAD